jgi:hypothetical protein
MLIRDVFVVALSFMITLEVALTAGLRKTQAKSTSDARQHIQVMDRVF